MNAKHILSKSTFIRSCQCAKSLYLHKYHSKLRNEITESQQAIFDRGTGIGELARGLFPEGVDASPPTPYEYDKSVAKTAQLIKEGVKIIYEAAFQFDGVLAALDILVFEKEKWKGYEVKGANSVSDTHILDASLQYHVIVNSGIPLSDISIVHLNKEYIRMGELDIRQLFMKTSVLKDVKEKQSFIKEQIEKAKSILKEKSVPKIDIGPHCNAPYPCDFSEHCWSHIPKKNSVFDLGSKGWELYKAGYKYMDEVPADYELPARKAFQFEHYKSGETFIDKERIKKFVTGFKYPLYFFDFETIMPGVPEFDQSHPYQQIPFQFSLHIQKKKGEDCEHHEFLGDGITDPRPALIEAMTKHIGISGQIVCYSMSFEKQRIAEMALDFPNYKKRLLAINDRIIDLMPVFQSRMYYHSDFKSGYSLKGALPALVPELSYEKLDIQEGGAASLTYSQLKHQDDAIRELHRKQLLEYCRLDTFAMVRILEKLYQIIH